MRGARPEAAPDQRWVVVHKGARDGYQVSLALAQAGKLDSLVTDWYSPLDRGWFGNMVDRAPAHVGSMLRRRYRDGLPSKRVSLYPRDYVLGRFEDGRDRKGDTAIGRRAGALARSHEAGILAYSCYAHSAFSAYGLEARPRVIFQVHPHPASLRRLFTEELELAPDGAASLSNEPEMSLTAAVFQQRCDEARLADVCIVASGYTRDTLIDNGIEPDRIHVIPYGVDLDSARPPEHPPSGPFRVLFVGQFTQRKGIKYLLEAWKRLALPNAELVLAGRGGADTELLARYADIYRFTGAVSREEIQTLYQTSDVLCMPSLAEGFGLVYLEAMAHGTPVIATPNTGAADLVSDGEDGFIVGIRDVEALMQRLVWCYENRAELAEMRAGARRVAERHSWEAFRFRIVQTLASVDSVQEPLQCR